MACFTASLARETAVQSPIKKVEHSTRVQLGLADGPEQPSRGTELSKELECAVRDR